VSFLIDPPWLFASGVAYGRMLPERTRTARVLHTATAATFLVTSISLYQNRRWTRPIWEACGAEDGRDWMLNSGVFKFDHRHAGARTHAISALLFASYPWWLLLGERVGRARTRRSGAGARRASVPGRVQSLRKRASAAEYAPNAMNPAATAPSSSGP